MLSFFLLTVPTLFLGASALTPANLISPARTTGALTALKYTNVGSSGTYKQVTNMIDGVWPSCTVSPSCIQEEKTVSGNLAPFDDEVTIAFRGPMTIDNIAVYQPANTSSETWDLVSSFEAGTSTDNMVFMNNMGGDTSGVWSICGGSSQSYADADLSGAAASATTPTGDLPSGEETNIMTATACSDSDTCSGFSRGTANHGWDGSKMFVFTIAMPGSDASAAPAVWLLNAQVVRAAQYGCNCRGEGVGGCGELDLLEVLENENATKAISEIYAMNSATGTGDNAWFARPTDESATYIAILDVETDVIAIHNLESWDYTETAVTRSTVDGYLNATTMTVSFGTTSSKRSAHSAFSAHRRRHNH